MRAQPPPTPAPSHSPPRVCRDHALTKPLHARHPLEAAGPAKDGPISSQGRKLGGAWVKPPRPRLGKPESKGGKLPRQSDGSAECVRKSISCSADGLDACPFQQGDGTATADASAH